MNCDAKSHDYPFFHGRKKIVIYRHKCRIVKNNYNNFEISHDTRLALADFEKN